MIAVSIEKSPAARGLARLGQVVTALVGRPLFWFIALGLAFTIPLSRAILRAGKLPTPPAMAIALPEFSLTDQHGRPFGSAELRGHVWVADFIFTNCPTACPKLTKRMGEVQHRSRHLGDAFRLVTFTVDPENDTPQVLAAYAARNHASWRWIFLTGSLSAIETTVVKGFKIAMGKEAGDKPNLFSIFHGERLVLVDAEGKIRGYYDADDAGIDALMQDIGTVVNGLSATPTH